MPLSSNKEPNRLLTNGLELRYFVNFLLLIRAKRLPYGIWYFLHIKLYMTMRQYLF